MSEGAKQRGSETGRQGGREIPTLFSGPMVRAILEGRKTVTRRVVKAPRGPLMWDLERAWVDHGFPIDAENRVLPMAQWGTAPDELYREQYLKVPFAHPADGWAKDPREDTRDRVFCPYGSPGDRLWVRETWGLHDTQPSDGPERAKVYYKATDGERHELRYQRWRPSIHMPRWASRLTPEVVSVRPERLQDITEEDAKAEGIRPFTKDGTLMKWWPCDPFDGPLKCAWQDLPRTAKDAFQSLWCSINGPGSWDANPWVWRVQFERHAPAGAIEEKIHG